ncbi:MAG: transporter substrate-binding domain-containing protein [Bacteroidota bacterium]
MKIIITIILVAFYPLISFCQDDKIIVGGDYNYPPYSFIDENGNEAGYDVDVINAIAELTGLDIEFSFENWDSTLTKLKTGEVNIIASIVYSAEREKVYDFSFPLHTEYYGIFAKKSTTINDINDLELKIPAILEGDISNELFYKPMGLFKDYATAQSFPEAFSLVNSGKCDYVIAPYPLGMKVINDNRFKNIEVKGPPIIPSVYCLAVKQGDYELLAWINQGIEILSRNGELDRIYKKWVKYQREEDQYKTFFHYTIIGLMILAGIIVVLLLFWYSLKRQVKKKALEIKNKEHVNFLKLQKAKKKVDLANKAKSTFLSTISHEIRTPLFAVIGFADLMAKTKLSEKQSGYNKKIRTSGKLLLNLVNDILDITKMEAEKIELSLEPFNLSELINEIYDIESEIALEKNIELTCNISDDVPKIVIGDRLRLSQILLNIINNSVKFTDKGKVSLLINVENLSDYEENDKTNIIFSIKDTGIGIPLHVQDKLFKPFEQLQNTNERKYGGTGLGLAISKQLTDLMGGEIMVESNLGKGSIFNVSIQFKLFKGKLKSSEAEFGISEPKENVSVLLVEDNEFNAEILIDQLTNANFSVTHAKSGSDTIKILESNHFQIILMDIEMPGMDGFETFEKIKKLNLTQAKVIALSAHDLSSEREKAKNIGMADYLCKPVSIKILNGTIRKYLPNIQKKTYKQSAIEIEKGLAFFENDKEKYKKALLRFKKYYTVVPEKLSELFNEDFLQIKDLTHNLKNASKTIAAMNLFDQAKKYDDILRSKPDDFTIDKLETLIAELKRVLKETDLVLKD